MEQRKLMQHGASSLTMALPMKWLKERGLKKGDSLFIETEGNKLIATTKESIKMEKISVNVDKLDRTSILLHLQSLYRFGYNEIEINFTKSSAIHYRVNKQVRLPVVVHEIVNRMIGAEVIEQSSHRMVIKYITKETEEDFKVVLRRAFLLLKETSKNLIEGVKENNHDLLSAVEDHHDNINKFVNYSLRLLNKYGYPDVKKTSFYYHIIASLDKIVDILKYNARGAIKYNKKYNKNTIEIWEHIDKSIQMYYDLFYKFDYSLVDKLSKNRDFTKNIISDKRAKLPAMELIQTTNMNQILELILDLTDFRMGLEY